MMAIEEIQVRKDDLSKTRAVSRDIPALNEGDVLAKVERFALTANNITYGVVGEKIGYWRFFPAPAGWGIIPVWGFAKVVQSRCSDVHVGERLFGYFPMASHLVMTPGKVRAERLVDGAAHRAGLPPVYNSYAIASREPGYDASMDDERMLLYPLYATSFCIYDFLLDNEWFGAEQAIVASASSKTAIGVAYALRNDPAAPSSVGLTSAGNAAKVRELALYGSVATYDALDSIDQTPSVIVDMSGNKEVLARLAERLGDNMRFCLQVGVTHHDASEGTMPAASDRRAFFFAPGHIQKRASDWGPGVFDAKALDFWREAAKKSRAWLNIDRIEGAAAAEKVFHDLREGKIGPSLGLIASV